MRPVAVAIQPGNRFDASFGAGLHCGGQRAFAAAARTQRRFFRLLGTVLDFAHTQTPGCMWSAITYFSVWATRLSGFLPDLAREPERRLSAASRELAGRMLRTHISEMPERVWNKDTALDLRRVLIHLMEEHVERHFHTPSLLEAL